MSDDRGQIRFVGNKKSESQNSLIYPIHIPIIILRSCRTSNHLYFVLKTEHGTIYIIQFENKTHPLFLNIDTFLYVIQTT